MIQLTEKTTMIMKLNDLNYEDFSIYFTFNYDFLTEDFVTKNKFWLERIGFIVPKDIHMVDDILAVSMYFVANSGKYYNFFGGEVLLNTKKINEIMIPKLLLRKVGLLEMPDYATTIVRYEPDMKKLPEVINSFTNFYNNFLLDLFNQHLIKEFDYVHLLYAR